MGYKNQHCVEMVKNAEHAFYCIVYHNEMFNVTIALTSSAVAHPLL